MDAIMLNTTGALMNGPPTRSSAVKFHTHCILESKRQKKIQLLLPRELLSFFIFIIIFLLDLPQEM